MAIGFPIQFVKEDGGYLNLINKTANFVGNALVVAAATATATAVSYFALKALGFTAAAKIAAITSITVASIGVAGAAATTVAFGALVVLAIYAASRQ